MTEAQMPERIIAWKGSNYDPKGWSNVPEVLATDEVVFIRADIVDALRKERDTANQGMIRLSQLDDDNLVEIAKLHEKLETARRDALEEAAKICDDIDHGIDADGTSNNEYPTMKCAEEIRALIDKDAP